MAVVADQVVREIVVDAPEWRVWSAITTPDEIKTWYAFGGAEVDYRVGGTLTFRWPEHGVFHGTVEAVDAPHRLVYRLSVRPDALPALGTSTRVEFTLTPDGERTRVRVQESGFSTLAGTPEELARHVAENDAGWHAGLAELARHVGSAPH